MWGEEMKCSKCGKEILPGKKAENEVFCAKCGIYEILGYFFEPVTVNDDERHNDKGSEQRTDNETS